MIEEYNLKKKSLFIILIIKISWYNVNFCTDPIVESFNCWMLFYKLLINFITKIIKILIWKLSYFLEFNDNIHNYCYIILYVKD